MESGQLDKGKRMRGGDVSGSWINDQGTVKGTSEDFEGVKRRFGSAQSFACARSSTQVKKKDVGKGEGGWR